MSRVTTLAVLFKRTASGGTGVGLHCQRRSGSPTPMIRTTALVFLLLASACEPETQSQPVEPPSSAETEPKPSRPPLTFKKTTDISTDAAFVALVEALAKHDEMESSHVGYAGSPSKIYAAYDKLANAATPEQILALAFHERPVVRGYMAAHIVRNHPQHHSGVAPLFGDDTALKTQQGCMGLTQNVANVVGDALCGVLRAGESDATAALSLAEAVIHDRSLNDDLRGAALGCLATRAGQRAAPIALALLEKRRLVAPALGALARAPSDDVSAIAPFVVDSKSPVRIAAARALGASNSEVALGLLGVLLGDDHPNVRHAAAKSYTRHSKAKLERVRELIEDKETRKSVAGAIAKSPRAAYLPLYASFIEKHPSQSRHSLPDLGRQRPTPELTRFFRQLHKNNVGKRSRDASRIRASAVFYLGRAKDTVSVAAMGKSLNGFDVHEVRMAKNALVLIGNDAAIAELEAAASSDSQLVREAARAGLRSVDKMKQQ